MVLGKIRPARVQLREAILTELLGLTVIRVAQNLEWKRSQSQFLCSSWMELLRACNEADSGLEDCVQMHMHSLEINCRIVSSEIEEMRNSHHAVLSRILKFAGLDLSEADEESKIRIMEEHRSQPVTALLMSQSLNDVLRSREIVRQVSSQTDDIQKSLNDLLCVVRI